MTRQKLEGSEIWESITEQSQDEKENAAKEYAAALEAVQAVIIANASKICLTWEAEDETSPATMAELMQAVGTARTEELRGFLKTRAHYIPWDGGYIVARW